MAKEKRPYICPVEYAGSLDNPIRKLVHKPHRILEAYISKGMTVLDLGCGPGFFTIEMAKLVGETGRVIAADLQQGMLDKVAGKIRGTDLEQRIELHKCQDDMIGISKKVDFVMAFWMVHEVPDQQRLFEELKSVMNPGGRIWIIEPRIHVTEKSFKMMISRLESTGLEIIERPGIWLSRSVLLTAGTNEGHWAGGEEQGA
ncbi:MAG: Methyltransferase type 11 [Bacteroidetes bacterium]|nr:Methyltransferase type 11 [Bacteroidota bacterium]